MGKFLIILDRSFFFFTFWIFSYFSKKEIFFKKIDKKKINLTSYKLFKIKFNFITKNVYYLIDLFFFYFLKTIFNKNFYLNNRILLNYKFFQTSLNYFDNQKTKILENKKLNFLFFLNSFFSGFSYFWNLIRFWFLGLILFILSFYFLTYIRLLPINKVLFEWFLVSMFAYWLLSGFVYFIKKYQFSKFTSVIQRFWKRSYILFWVLETFLFLIYFYLTLNASEEPVYMYDQLKLYKTHFFSWRLFILKIIPVITLIVLSFYLQLSLKWSLFQKQSIITISITILLIYIVWLEFYQFFHIISFFGNLNWVFDYDEYLWNLELEFRRTRLANNYVAVCLIAKFWHLIFIFIFWVFFVLRINEIGRIRYPLLAANTQNFIILYILTWLYMYPWFKFVLRNFLDSTFYWFMTNNRLLALRIFFNDLKLFINIIFLNFFEFFNFNLLNFNELSFFYWNESSSHLNFNQFKKHNLKDYIINSFN